ncbi:MAG: endonuclease/exonuclease/phosphatase family protein [Bacteroidetes bacterium]|nr:endonuclease/exonuclease/phosphatase family protein [Bacteroidota bacterium]
MKYINKVVFIFNIIALIALIGSYLATYISPALWWQIAFLGLAFPFVFIINVCFALFWLFQWDIRIWYAIGTFVLGSIHIYHSIQFGTQKTEQQTNRINVVTFNTHNFGVYEKNGEYDSSVFFNALRDIKPDIMCFQEFVALNTDIDTRMYQQLFKEYKSYYKYNVDDNEKTPTGYSVSIFSKYKIIKSGLVERVNMGGNCTIYSDILVNKDTIRLINTHLKSISFQQKDYEIVSELQEGDKQSNVDMKGVKGVLSRLKRAFINRSKQVDIIKNFIDNSPYKIIICGDFNDSPTSYSYNMLKGDKKDAFVESGSGMSATYVGRMPNFRIDYILCDKAFNVFNYKPQQLNFGDHKMLSASLTY